eukprot:ANDGO_05902.mRNA.1 hypothetical protein
MEENREENGDPRLSEPFDEDAAFAFLHSKHRQSDQTAPGDGVREIDRKIYGNGRQEHSREDHAEDAADQTGNNDHDGRSNNERRDDDDDDRGGGGGGGGGGGEMAQHEIENGMDAAEGNEYYEDSDVQESEFDSEAVADPTEEVDLNQLHEVLNLMKGQLSKLDIELKQQMRIMKTLTSKWISYQHTAVDAQSLSQSQLITQKKAASNAGATTATAIATSTGGATTTSNGERRTSVQGNKSDASRLGIPRASSTSLDSMGSLNSPSCEPPNRSSSPSRKLSVVVPESEAAWEQPPNAGYEIYDGDAMVEQEIEIARRHIRSITDQNKRLSKALEDAKHRIQHGFTIDDKVAKQTRIIEAKRNEIVSIRQKLDRMEKLLHQIGAVKQIKGEQEEKLIRYRHESKALQQENIMLRSRVQELEGRLNDTQIRSTSYLSKSTQKEMTLMEGKLMKQEKELQKMRTMMQEKYQMITAQDSELQVRQRRIKQLEVELAILAADKEKVLITLLGAQGRAAAVEENFEKKTRMAEHLFRKKEIEMQKRESVFKEYNAKVDAGVSLIQDVSQHLQEAVKEASSNAFAENKICGLDKREAATLNSVFTKKIEVFFDIVKRLHDKAKETSKVCLSATEKITGDPAYSMYVVKDASDIKAGWKHTSSNPFVPSTPESDQPA